MADHLLFPGGVHPKDGKSISFSMPIQSAPLLEEYTIPLSQHIGTPAQPIVKRGQRVLKGQKIAEATDNISAHIHAPTSGEITSVSKHPITGEMLAMTNCIGPAGHMVSSLVITSDGEDKEGFTLMPIEEWQSIDKKILLERIKEAGIVGMGGAAFPTHVKLNPPQGKRPDTLIINGAECEPFLTADHRLMLEEPEKIIEGILMMKYILGAKTVYIGIERNKPDAIKTMKKHLREGIEVRELRVLYPQGSEKQLIYALTKRKVRMGTLPMEVNCIVQNIGTAFAVFEAIVMGKPLFERITTITGEPVVRPGNWRLRIGTSIGDALKMAGGVKDPEKVGKILIGGPMMGLAQFSLDTPIMKSGSGVTLLNKDEIVQYTSVPCIRCGRCVDVCPMNLMPSTMSIQAMKERFDLLEEWHVMDCLECGCCSYVCPSQRPLVQLFRLGKSHVLKKRQRELEKLKAKG